MKKRVCFLYLLLVICLNTSLQRFNQVQAGGERPDLYSPFDDVIRLNSSNFDSTLFQEKKNVTYMVQFYNTFCGHCQMFAPIYKNLATRLKNWTSIVQLAGVDCSKDENVITCSENKVSAYPTVYIFPPNSVKGSPKDEPLSLRSLNIEWTVDDIEEGIIDYLGNLTSTGRLYPPAIKAFKPLDIPNLTEFQRLYVSTSGHDEAINDRHAPQDLMFIIESEKSYLGRKLIAEYYRIHSRLELRRISLDNKALLLSMLTDKDYLELADNQPILVRANFPEDESRKGFVLVKGEEKHVLPSQADSEREDFIYNRFKMFFEHYYSVELKEAGYKDSANSEQDKKLDSRTASNNIEDLEIRYLLHNDPIGSKIFAIDLLKSISYIITHEIKIKGDLGVKEYNIVRDLLTILKKYLPLGKWDASLLKFVTDLRTRLDENRDKYQINGIKAQEMRDLLELSGADAIRLRYNRENWISCHNSDRRQKGYTCSVWLLFHSLTVGEFIKSAPVRVKPTMVLFTMRDYITKFLGCTVCSSNFEKETETLEANLIHRNSSTLWLWNTHNLVNQRLNSESEAPARKPLIDVIFPSPRSCPNCYITDVERIGVDGKTLADIQWDKQRVLDFMVNMYKPDRIVTPVELASIMAKIKRKVSYDMPDEYKADRYTASDLNRSIEEWNIQSIDLSICLILYGSCIMIVAIVCIALNPKWMKSKSK